LFNEMKNSKKATAGTEFIYKYRIMQIFTEVEGVLSMDSSYKEITNKLFNLVAIFWIVIFEGILLTTIVSIFSLTNKIVPYSILTRIISGFFIGLILFSFYPMITKVKMRLLRILYEIIYLLVIPLLFSVLVFITLNDVNISSIAHLIWFFIFMSFLYLNIVIIKLYCSRRSIKIKGDFIDDLSVSLSFAIALLTIVYTVVSLVPKLEEYIAIPLLIFFLVPFSLNLLMGSILYYFKTNGNTIKKERNVGVE